MQPLRPPDDPIDHIPPEPGPPAPEPPKPWWRSETVNASLGAAAGGVLTIVMVLAGQDDPDLLFPALISVIGAMGAIHGRIRAKSPIDRRVLVPKRKRS